MPQIKRALVLLSHCLLTLGAESPTEHFIFPGTAGNKNDYSHDDVWQLGTTQRLRWQTDFPTYNLTLYQQPLDGGTADAGPIIYGLVSYHREEVHWLTGTSTAKSPDDSEVGGFEWTVQTYSLNLDDSPVFFAWLIGPGVAVSFTSHYFNISAEAASASSVAASSTTFSSTVALSATQALSTSATSASTTTAQAAHSDIATRLGLGVGLGIGLPIFILLSVFVGMKVLKTRQAHVSDQPVYVGARAPKDEYSEYIGPTQNVLAGPRLEPVEVPAGTAPVEMQ